ncbi:MAG: divergent polysaccharide deacetylase family protein [Limnochordaceae bacterium]|nr:divergent polysaccharide deacetylase family protein [Limnochordaceae bacterium]
MRASGPRLAIVIDDWGYDWQAAERLLKLDAPITVAVLPFLPYSREQALRARSRGFEVLVHLPMEPDDPSVSPGPGAVTTQMNDIEVREAVRRAIEAVPGAVGVNNHMGSRATADPRVMRQVLAEVARHGMFYVDSATSPHSVGAAVASAMGVPWARNQLFLDGEPSVQAVRSRLQLAMQRALRTGAAVAIGHVRPATAAALESMLPQLRREGVLLVPVSALLHR